MRGYVLHDEEVAEVMTELAEENMPGVVWLAEEDEALEQPAQRNSDHVHSVRSKAKGCVHETVH